MIIYQVTPHPLAIFFPLMIIPLVLASFCLGLFTGIIRALAKDIAEMIDEVVKMLIFITPVLYTMEVQSGILAKIVKYNPLSYLIESPRQLLLQGSVDNWSIFIGISIGLLLLTAIFVHFFLKLASRIPERVIQI